VELNYDISERYSEMLTDGSLILEPSLPYKKCLSILKSSDLVVNIQPGTKTQVPSKLYDYLSIDRPILTISDRAGALGQLVENYQLGDLFSFDEQKALTQWLIDLADSLDKDEAFHPYPAKDVFDCTNIANTLAEKLAHVSQR
jgi:hypothetical protein